jgi:hypothetical protein
MAQFDPMPPLALAGLRAPGLGQDVGIHTLKHQMGEFGGGNSGQIQWIVSDAGA